MHRLPEPQGPSICIRPLTWPGSLIAFLNPVIDRGSFRSAAKRSREDREYSWENSQKIRGTAVALLTDRQLRAVFMSKTMTTHVGRLGTIIRPEKETHPLGNYWKSLIPIAAGLALLLLPIPEGLKPNAWYYFALFVAVIIALILEPIPAAAVGLMRVTAATVSLLVAPKPADAIKWALSGFQDGTVWLIFVAFMF